MPSPDTGDLHVNVLLSNMSTASMNAMDSYIADRVFPFLYVDNQSNVYAKFNKAAFLTDAGIQSMARAPGTLAAQADYSVDLTSTYRCDNFAVGNSIPDELRANSDAMFNLDMQATNLVTEYQLIRRERAFAADFMVTTKWTTDVTGGSTVTKWSDYGASDPIGDIRTYKRTIQKATAVTPNKLVMGQIVMDRLADHPDFLYRVAGGATNSNPATVSNQLIAGIVGVDQILVGNSIYNTTADGSAGTFTGDYVIDDDALLLYTPPSPGLMTPSAGYTFVWRTAVNGSASPQFIRKIRDDRRKRDIVEAFSYWDQAQTDAGAGVFFSDIVD